MTHWHQCVKYTLPRCSFQFIFLLVSCACACVCIFIYIYMYIYKSSQKERGYRGRPKPAGWLRLMFRRLQPGAGGPSSNALHKYQLRFLPSPLHCANDVMTKPRGIAAAARSTPAPAAPGAARPSPAHPSTHSILNLLPRTRVFSPSRPSETPGKAWAVRRCLWLLIPWFQQENDFFFFSCPTIKYFLGGRLAWGKSLFPK